MSCCGYLPLGGPVQDVPIAAPPHHGEGHVTLKHAKRLRRVGDVEAQAHAGAQVEKAMLRHPLPQHAARGPPTVLQHQSGAIHRDAAFQLLTLQDEQALFCSGVGGREDEQRKKERKGKRGGEESGRFFEYRCGNYQMVVFSIRKSV